MAGLSPYTCLRCDLTEDRSGTFVDVPEASRVYKGEQLRLEEICDLCGGPMVWTPLTANVGLINGGTGLEVDLDGQKRVFSSYHEMRQFSADSIKRARNGEGKPTVFRALEQNVGNMDRNTLRGSEFETGKQVPLTRETRRGLKIAGGALTPAAAAAIATTSVNG